MFCKTMFWYRLRRGEGSGVWETPVDTRLNRIDLAGAHSGVPQRGQFDERKTVF